jgi:elongation factor P
MSVIKAIDLRRGMAVNYKNGVWVCVENNKVAKGNWRSYQVIQIKNIQTGQTLEERFRTDEEMEQAMLVRKQMEYLYTAGPNLVMMDPDSYEQVNMPVSLVGDLAVFLLPNIVLEVSMVDDKPVVIELPNVVELTVVDTPPEMKGATATNQLKDAVCDGGARVRVPAFVVNGTKIKVDTRTGEYLSRA